MGDDPTTFALATRCSTSVSYIRKVTGFGLEPTFELSGSSGARVFPYQPWTSHGVTDKVCAQCESCAPVTPQALSGPAWIRTRTFKLLF